MIYKKDNIILRPFTEFELQNPLLESAYVHWFDIPKIVNLTSHGIFPMNRKDIEKYVANNGNEYIVYMILDSSIGETKISEEFNVANINNKHIGNIALQSINWINRSAELAIIIGEEDYHGKGIATFAVRCMLYHAFIKMGLNRVWSGTSCMNIGMQEVFKKCGFEQEGIFRGGKWSNGEFVDIYSYAILAFEFQAKGYAEIEEIINE